MTITTDDTRDFSLINELLPGQTLTLAVTAHDISGTGCPACDSETLTEQFAESGQVLSEFIAEQFASWEAECTYRRPSRVEMVIELRNSDGDTVATCDRTCDVPARLEE